MMICSGHKLQCACFTTAHTNPLGLLLINAYLFIGCDDVGLACWNFNQDPDDQSENLFTVGKKTKSNREHVQKWISFANAQS